jgi:hypothetical protein
MLSTDEAYGGWPQSGEIDIMEFTASRPDNVYGTMHYGPLYPNNQYQGKEYYLLEGLFPDDFHEFAVEWEPNEIRWFVDGVLYSTKTSADVSPYNWPFDQNFHFLLNLAIGGNLGGSVDNGIFPVTMEVDYVRVYDGFKASIQGNRVVSNQANGVSYALNNLPNGTNVSWSVPGGASIASGQGSDQITVDFGYSSGYVTATFNNGCENQTISIGVEVEPPYIKNISFENFDEIGNAILNSSTGILTEVSNPNTSGVNTSALSGSYVRNSSEQFDILVYNTASITNADNYVTKDKKFLVDVYTSAPIGTEVFIQLETSNATSANYPTGRHSRFVATISQNNTWQRLSFSLLDQPDPTASATDVGTMIVLFNSNTFTGDTYLFDNLDSYIIDMGGGSNQSPVIAITNPSDQSTFSENTTIGVTADASDSDGSISLVEFFVNGNSIGTDASQPYGVNWTIGQGVFQLSAVATDNQGATSTTSITVNGQGQGGQAASVHVSSIVIGSASAGKGNKNGTATVTIVDDLGNPVNNATVNVTFSGTFNETKSGVTNTSGVVVLTTSGNAKGSITVNVCVDNVSAVLPYVSSDNLITCTGGTARIALLDELLEQEKLFQIYPNPVVNRLHLELAGFENQIRISVIDLSGRIVFLSNRTIEQINVSNWPKGVYILEVTDGKTIERRRFIK